MRWPYLSRLLFLAVWSVVILGQTPAAEPARPVVQLDVQGAIGPATADYVHRGLTQARERNAILVILRIDTPGGLDTAMRDIIKDIIASEVPVATFVAPSGARAASAGAYILLASHIAAMAPATNVGAATPVRIGGVPDPGASREPADEKQKPDKDQSEKSKAGKPGMDEKVMNDAIAYIRGLAQMRGRNAEWAERAVREAASTSAEEAVKQNVADLIAADVPELLKKLHGRRLTLDGKEIQLATEGLAVTPIGPDWRNRLLTVITDPNVAYILMMLGIYGLFFELWNPGYVLPGVVGGICLLLALYAFQALPVNYAGFGLILLGIGFMVAEAFIPSFGALGIGGVVAFVVGSIILLDTSVPGYDIAWELIAVVAAFSSALIIGVVTLAVRARQRAVVSGREELIGAEAEALEAFTGLGRVRVHSEDWQARTRHPVAAGDRVTVVGLEGLTLIVESKQ